MRYLCFLGVAALVMASGAAAQNLIPELDQQADNARLSIHAQQLQLHRFDQPFLQGPYVDDEIRAAADAWEESRPHKTRGDLEIIGYLPYWVGGAGGLRLDLLTQVNYFSAEMDSAGNLTSLHGWGDQASQDLVTAAHAEGCRVALVTTNFSSSGIHSIVSNPTVRQDAIDNLLEQVLLLNADGVDVDFEGMDVGDKADLVTFMEEMTTAFEAELADPWLTLATPAVDWDGSYDYDELIYNSSGLFIMGYAYHYGGGNPGPVAPKDGSATWGNYSLTWTVEDYLEWGGQQNRAEIYLGLPLYGYDWPSTSDNIPGTATGSASAIFYDEAIAQAAIHGELWDADSTTPYYLYQDNGWHQAWYEHADSILAKIDLVEDYDLGGFGFWALQYDDNDPDLWDEIEALVGDDDDDDSAGDDDDDTTPGDGVPTAVVDERVYLSVGETAVLDGSESSDPDGDELSFQWTQTGGAEVSLGGATLANATFEAEQEGTLYFQLVVSDGAHDSAPAEAKVVIFPPDSKSKNCECSASDVSDQPGRPVPAPALIVLLVAAALRLRRSRRGP